MQRGPPYFGQSTADTVRTAHGLTVSASPARVRARWAGGGEERGGGGGCRGLGGVSGAGGRQLEILVGLAGLQGQRVKGRVGARGVQDGMLGGGGVQLLPGGIALLAQPGDENLLHH